MPYNCFAMEITAEQVLKDLNTEQREAVTAAAGHWLVLAGAGCGKTRVLVHRIAWHLVAEDGIAPHNIFAVTFTNKAAREMRERLGALLRNPAPGMWVGTFHGMCHRLLRTHWEEAGLKQGFQVLDGGDQLRLVKRTVRNLQINEEQYEPRQMCSQINAFKEQGLRPDAAAAEPGLLPVVLNVYRAYEQACADNNLVDFAELLLRANELLQRQKQLRDHYRQRFTRILVDEFQDTNSLQYRFIQLLAGATGHVFAVGDDDQSIYSWRGAQPGHMIEFAKDFTNSGLLKLEQNYRSAGTILLAANSLIEHNTGRLGKKLWTASGSGEPINVFSAYNDYNEATYVANDIGVWYKENKRYDDVAVLYRANAQSRVLEESLIRAGIPYRIYGGLRFYEREEIKDAMSYLRLLLNRDDDLSFARVVNVPARRIGAQTIAVLNGIARDNLCSLWRSAIIAVAEKRVAAKTCEALQSFMDLVAEMAKMRDSDLPELVKQVIAKSKLKEHYHATRKEYAVVKEENLLELVNAASDFAEAFMQDELEVDEDVKDTPLHAFLTQASLESGENVVGSGDDQVHLMTLHSAKGLEFNKVFMVGLEEGLFPHSLCLGSPQQLEEERRLCYVGITRARHRLTLSHAWRRRMYGREQDAVPSRFIRNLPQQLLQPVGESGLPVSNAMVVGAAAASLGLGCRVMHKQYGEGVIIDFEGKGLDARVMVNFMKAGKKWMLADVASLRPMA